MSRHDELVALVAERIARIVKKFDAASVEHELTLSIGRVMLKEAKKDEFIEASIALDEQDEIDLNCSILPDHKARHIVDWLKAAKINNEPWMHNLDDMDRIKKLMKFSSLTQIHDEADKAMRIKAQQSLGITVSAGDERLIKVLEDGYHIVQMLTPTALDRESAFMQHCIGNGAYDEGLDDSEVEYLSLRDKMGKPHATLEIRNEMVVQLQGKQNKSPAQKYLDLIIPFLKERKLGWNNEVCRQGGIYDSEYNFHPLDAPLPDGLCVNGNIDFIETSIAALPNNFKIIGKLSLDFTRIKRIEDGLDAYDISLEDSDIEYISPNIRIGGDLILANCQITELPDNLKLGRDLDLRGSSLERLPNGLSAGGDIFIDDTGIIDIPPDLKCDMLILNDLVDTIPEGLSEEIMVCIPSASPLFFDPSIALETPDAKTLPLNPPKVEPVYRRPNVNSAPREVIVTIGYLRQQLEHMKSIQVAPSM